MYLSCTWKVRKKLTMENLPSNISIFLHRIITLWAGCGTIGWSCDEGIASVQSGRSIASPACYLYFKHWLGPLINISPTPNGPGVSDLNYNADNCHTDGQPHVLELNRQYFFSLLKRLHMKWILKPISKYQA